MATLNLKLNTTYSPKGETENEKFYPLVIKVSHRRVAKNIPTGYKLRLKDWDGSKLKIKKSFSSSGRANVNVLRQWEAANSIVDELSKAQLKQMDVYQLVSLIEVALIDKSQDRVSKLLPGQSSNTIVDQAGRVTYLDEYAEAYKAKLYRDKRYGIYRQIDYMLGAIKRFYGNTHIPLKKIDEDFLSEMESWWRGKDEKNSYNTLSTILKNLRKLYNLAIKDKQSEIKKDDYPFGIHGFSIKKEQTRKRAIKEEDLQKIRALQLEEGSQEWHSRNYFLFMLNCWGMGFGDMARLRPQNITGDRSYLSYKRNKLNYRADNSIITIKLTEEARAILSHYWPEGTTPDYIFPILNGLDPKNISEQILQRIANKNQHSNAGLKTIGQQIGLDYPLTSYVARHTFSTIGKKKGVPVEKISELLGHSSLKTTQVYLASFEREELDDAAEMILS